MATTKEKKAIVYKQEKLSNAIKQAFLDDKELKGAVMDYIFSGNPDEISPLKSVRDTNKL